MNTYTIMVPGLEPQSLETVARALTDDGLTALHATVHAEWARRYPDGDWPQAELAERRRELRAMYRSTGPGTFAGMAADARGVPVQVLKISPNATLPSYQTDGAAGMDLHACLDYHGEDRSRENPVDIIISAGSRRHIHTGIRLSIPPGYEGQIRSRSGLSTQQGLAVINSPGTVDSDYRGEIIVCLINHGCSEARVVHGVRIAQLVLAPVSRVRLVEVDALDGTERGSGGFGSTGQ